VGRVCRNPTEPLVFKSVPDYCNQNAAPGAVDAHAKGGEMERINIAEKFARFSEQWQLKIVAELNGQEVKLVKVQGTFPWHHHDDVEEMFWCGAADFASSSGTGLSSWGPASLSSCPAVSSIALLLTKKPR
jgi:hypothetical protein